MSSLWRCKVFGSVLTCVLVASAAKGHVVRSQLTREDLTGVTLFLRAHCLLCLTSVQRVQQIVIWREVGVMSCGVRHVVWCHVM